MVLICLLKFVNSDKCPNHCLKCQRGVCNECKEGYGLEDNQCKRCERQNCVNCDSSSLDCRVCAPYHYLSSIEGGKYHECSKCGFGCMACANQHQCLTCASMFVPNIIDLNGCIVNHIYLFLILVVVSGGACCFGCLAYYCSPGPGESNRLVTDHLQTQAQGILETEPNLIDQKPKETTQEDEPSRREPEVNPNDVESKPAEVDLKSKNEDSDSDSEEGSEEESSSEDSSSQKEDEEKEKQSDNDKRKTKDQQQPAQKK